jgi:hypothetical protein
VKRTRVSSLKGLKLSESLQFLLFKYLLNRKISLVLSMIKKWNKCFLREGGMKIVIPVNVFETLNLPV